MKEFRDIVREMFATHDSVFKKLAQLEDVDRLRRAQDGYGETEFEEACDAEETHEDVDRLRRAADGYGETEFEEANDYIDGSDLDDDENANSDEEDFEDQEKNILMDYEEGKMPTLKQIFNSKK